MTDIVKNFFSAKSTQGYRTSVLVILGWLAWGNIETKKDLSYLREHRCRCGQITEQAAASAPAAPAPTSTAPASIPAPAPALTAKTPKEHRAHAHEN
jgi:hypothetical protein